MRNRVLNEDEVRRKFDLNARLWLAADTADRVADAVFLLDGFDDVTSIMATTSPVGENRTPE
jgi:hypothetical protein